MRQSSDKPQDMRQSSGKPQDMRQSSGKPQDMRQSRDKPQDMRQSSGKPQDMRQSRDKPQGMRQSSDKPQDMSHITRQETIVPSLKSSTARNSLMPASVSAGWDSLSESSCDWRETEGKEGDECVGIKQNAVHARTHQWYQHWRGLFAPRV